MSILTFWKQLLPNIGQDRVLDDIAKQRDEIENSLNPNLSQARNYFRHHPLHSVIGKTYERNVQVKLKLTHQGLFEILQSIFKDVPSLLDRLEKMVTDTFEKDQPKESLTYRRANVIQLLGVIAFTVRYTQRSIIRIISAESALAYGSGEAEALTDNERAFFDGKFQQWVDSLAVLNGRPEDILASIASIPDVVIDEKNEGAVSAVAGAANMDPLRMNFISPDWNPIYKLRLIRSEYEVASLNQAREERKLVELKLRQLNEAKGRGHDPHLEQAIAVSEDRLKKLDYKIAKVVGEAA